MLKKITLINLLLLMFIVPIQAWSKPEDIAACERQNLIYGCNCECRDEIDPSGNVNKPNDLICNATGSTPTCVNSRVAPQNTNDVLHVVDIFPVGSGLLIYNGNQLNIPATITNLLKWVFFILAFLAVILGLYGAFKYSTAQADDDQVGEAQKIMRNALIGFVIALAAAIIVTYVSRLLGFAQ